MERVAVISHPTVRSFYIILVNRSALPCVLQYILVPLTLIEIMTTGLRLFPSSRRKLGSGCLLPFVSVLSGHWQCSLAFVRSCSAGTYSP